MFDLHLAQIGTVAIDCKKAYLHSLSEEMDGGIKQQGQSKRSL